MTFKYHFIKTSFPTVISSSCNNEKYFFVI